MFKKSRKQESQDFQLRWRGGVNENCRGCKYNVAGFLSVFNRRKFKVRRMCSKIWGGSDSGLGIWQNPYSKENEKKKVNMKH